MAYHHGNEGSVKVTTNAVAEVQSWTYNERDVAVLEKTSIGDTSASYIAAGCKGGDGSVTCLWDETDTTGQGALTAGASVTLNLYPEGSTAADTYWGGTAIVESFSVDTAKDGFVGMTFNFKGVLTKGTVPT